MKAGDLLTVADGTQSEVTEVTFEDRHETVYNMEVADYHTYYVGEDGVWVHNRYGQQARGGRRARENGSGSATSKLVSSVHNDPRLVKAAEEVGKNERIQQEANHLINELLSGNTNPGLGTENLFEDITYLRGRNGARIFYRTINEEYEILAKANKTNEQTVINILKKLYE